jgi:hypothetical protein
VASVISDMVCASAVHIPSHINRTTHQIAAGRVDYAVVGIDIECVSASPVVVVLVHCGAMVVTFEYAFASPVAVFLIRIT